MSLQLYNTLGRSIQEFQPITPGKVGFYGCGPTVYNFAHIGNLRAYVCEDILARTLRYLGYDVTHVMNITDVGHLSGDNDEGDDKMVKSAEERGKTVLEIAKYYTDAFFNDCAKLNIVRPTVVCPATQHIGDMIELIKKIEANGYTYSSGGNLYFDTSKFANYGKMAMLRLDDQQAGARIDVDENKKNPRDFVLWFTKSKFENQALTWDSPWGRGYPGWHIECSAMSMKYLGESFDIHAGGIDHITVHHTNEIAQSEAATGHKWVNFWMHVEFIVMGLGAKMSKSKGGFITLSNIIEKGYNPLDYRYFLLNGHYRSPLQFSWDALDSAKASYASLSERILTLRAKLQENSLSVSSINEICPQAKDKLANFKAAIENDLAIPKAIAELWAVLKDNSIPAQDALCVAFDMDRVLGLDLEKIEKASVDESLAKEVEALIEERALAKKAKNFARADEIRNELKDKGIQLKDSPSGTTWEKI